jgi:membrane protease YdiL (CAAX protease family)
MRLKSIVLAFSVAAMIEAIDLALRWLGLHPKGWHWNFSHHALYLIAPLVLAGVLTGRRTIYALNLVNWGKVLALGVIVSLPMVGLPLLCLRMNGLLQWSPQFAATMGQTLLFQIVFVAIGEELFFRGFMQGELNRAFGQPWHWGAARFGLGVVCVVIWFGIGHGLTLLIVLFQMGLSKSVWSMLFLVAAVAVTGSFALVAGLVREYTDSLIAVAVMHLSWNFCRNFMAQSEAAELAWAIGVGISMVVSLLIVRFDWWRIEKGTPGVVSEPDKKCWSENML